MADQFRRLLLCRRRAARHAYGSVRRRVGARPRERCLGARSDEDVPPVRRGAVREADRARHRLPAARAAVRADERARRHDQGRDPGAGTLRGRASGQAGVPGAPDRRQRRADRTRGCTSGGGRPPAPGRPDRRHQLPLARGPDREALPPRSGARLHLPARLPDLHVREGAGPPRDASARSPAAAGRDGCESACRVGTAKV